MISALAWIPKGAAKPVPEAAEVSEEELAAMSAAAEAAGKEEEAREEESEGSEDDSGEELPDALPSDSSDEEEDEAAAVARARAAAAALRAESAAAAGGPSAGGDALASALAELDMDHYDDSDDELTLQRMLGSGNPGQAYYRDPREVRCGRRRQQCTPHAPLCAAPETTSPPTAVPAGPLLAGRSGRQGRLQRRRRQRLLRG